MFDLNFLLEFSRNHCLSICAFLVPANMVATLQTMIFVGMESPKALPKLLKLAPIIFMAVVYAVTMILHVFSWFVAGVVMAPTFILLSLGIVCLGINIWAIASPLTLGNLLRTIWQFLMVRLSIDKIWARSNSVAISE